MRFFGIGFLVLIFLEIMSIVWVADWLGGGITLLLMIVSFVAGVMMLRNTGLSGILLAGATMRSGGEVSMY
ncbi:MAG: FxsA family protein, partial [Neisseria sp.]|nr:FxsA family protein [Neisseria sp.]